MWLFSTVLFVDGNPVGYKVFEENNRLLLNPAENPNRAVHAPVLTARNDHGSWKVEGTQNIDLIDQVIEDVTLNHVIPRNNLSAAP